MWSHHPGHLPRRQTLLRQFMLVVAGCVICHTPGIAADQPASPPRIVIIRGEHRSEFNLYRPATGETAFPSVPATGTSPRPETETPAPVPAAVEGFSRHTAPRPDDPASHQVTTDVPRFARPNVKRPVESTRPPAQVVPDDGPPIDHTHLNGAHPVDGPAAFDQIVPMPERWLSAHQKQFEGRPAVDRSAAGGQIVAAPDDELPSDQGTPEPARLQTDGREHSSEFAAGNRELESDGASIPSTHVVAPVAQFPPTTMMKLDSVQAAWFGAGILLCLSCQVAIIVALVRQRSRHRPLIVQRQPAACNTLSHPGDRATAVADFNTDARLLDGAGSTFDHEWQLEEDEIRQQEAMMIEELVSMNVKMAPELSQC